MIKYLWKTEKNVCSLLGFFKDRGLELSQFRANNLADVWPSANPDLNSTKYIAGSGEYYCFSIARLNCKSSPCSRHQRNYVSRWSYENCDRTDNCPHLEMNQTFSLFFYLLCWMWIMLWSWCRLYLVYADSSLLYSEYEADNWLEHNKTYFDIVLFIEPSMQIQHSIIDVLCIRSCLTAK